ncbi:hypothetical protein QQF64_002965 [Cirrhinus molitorella]|uniref:Uncharacterized protein n=1 Tax=Cirrhinus molitorella TaxID=172907 RepID=A0ABR3MIS7_9TELE
MAHYLKKCLYSRAGERHGENRRSSLASIADFNWLQEMDRWAARGGTRGLGGGAFCFHGDDNQKECHYLSHFTKGFAYQARNASKVRHIPQQRL